MTGHAQFADRTERQAGAPRNIDTRSGYWLKIIAVLVQSVHV